MKNIHEVLNHKGETLSSPDPFHPGYILKEEIEAREIIKKEFAELLNILPTHLSEIFAGKRPIGPKMARRLEAALDISAGFWLRMQSDYDLKLALQEPDPALGRIQNILEIQQRSNTSLAKAMIAYEIAQTGQSAGWVLNEGKTIYKTKKAADSEAEDKRKSDKSIPTKGKRPKKS